MSKAICNSIMNAGKYLADMGTGNNVESFPVYRMCTCLISSKMDGQIKICLGLTATMVSVEQCRNEVAEIN